MFGVSFPELLVLGTVALLVLGPDKLPGMLRTMGQWVAKLRRLTTEVRYQSGIDEVLRAEGFDGGLGELRSIMRGGAAAVATQHTPPRQPVVEQFVSDRSREYPPEGPDAYGALPEDLLSPAPPLPVEAPLAIEAPSPVDAPTTADAPFPVDPELPAAQSPLAQSPLAQAAADAQFPVDPELPAANASSESPPASPAREAKP